MLKIEVSKPHGPAANCKTRVLGGRVLQPLALPHKSFCSMAQLETCRRHVMFIETNRLLVFRIERNAEHFARCGSIKNTRVTINISPLCGDDSVQSLDPTFEAKPTTSESLFE